MISSLKLKSSLRLWPQGLHAGNNHDNSYIIFIHKFWIVSSILSVEEGIAEKKSTQIKNSITLIRCWFFELVEFGPSNSSYLL